MGSNNIGIRQSFALQAAHACMEKIEFPINLTGVWGPFDRPRTLSDTFEVSRVVLNRIRLLSQPFMVIGSVSDVFDHADGMTSMTFINLSGASYALRFHCWVGEDGRMQAREDKRYTDDKIALCELEAIGITRHPQFEFYAACHPAEATVLRTGLGRGGFVVLDTAVKDFREFEKEHLQSTPTPA